MNDRSRTSLYLLLASIGLTPLATTATSLTLRSLPLTYDSFVIPKLTALVALAGAALVAWAQGARGTVRWSREAYAMAAFTGLMAVSTVTALDPAVAVFGRDSAAGILAYLGFFAAFFLLLQHVSDTGRVRSLAWTMLASGTVAASASLYQAVSMTADYVSGLGLGDVGFLYGRGGGLFGNPDFVGAFLVVPLVIAAGLVVGGRDVQERAAAAAGGLLIAAAMVVTQVRAGWVGAATGVVVLAALVLPRARSETRCNLLIVGGALAAALVLGVALVGPAGIMDRLSLGAGEGLDAISSGRLTGWRSALGVIAERPLTGTGPDSFTFGWYRGAETLADPSSGARSYFEDPHNVYLSIAATMGVPAALALITLVGLALRAGVRNLRATSEQPTTRGLYAAWLAALCGLLVTMIFAVTTIPTMLVLFVCTAVLMAPGAHKRELPPGALVAVRGLAVAVALVLFVVGTLPIRADYHLGRHMRTGSIDSLDRARAVAPWEKTIQLRYLAVTRAALVPLLQAGTPEAYTAVEKWDAETYRLIDAHPHELLYTIERLDLLGQAAGMLGPAIGEKNLVVANIAVADYPRLQDFRVYRARALNNLDRYDDAVEVLEPLPKSVTRDAALAESYLLAGDEDAARAVAATMRERYPGSAYAEAFLAQPTIIELLAE